MTTQQRTNKLNKMYQMLEDNYSRQTEWVAMYRKPMSSNTYTNQIIRQLTSRISTLEAGA